jgi:hypothetical protein
MTMTLIEANFLDIPLAYLIPTGEFDLASKENKLLYLL